MQCPVCEIDTIVVERNEIEIDYCISCRGFWFDSGEIELLAEKLECDIDLSELAKVEDDRHERPRKCLRCGKKMVKASLSGSRRVTIDWCNEGHGLWFDAGEVGVVLQRRGEGGDDADAILNFLGEVIGP